eukprot:gene12730-26815_t
MSGSILATSAHNIIRSTAASGAMVYEGTRAVNEYLLFHYGSDNILLPYSFGPKDALNFPTRCANICSTFKSPNSPNIRSRALDLGCAVGGSSFELSRHFENVLGIDFSKHFVDAANEMKLKGEMSFEILKHGTVFEKHVAKLPINVVPNNVEFQQGDACNLDPSIGTFDVILASNLLCRLPSPRKFISDIKSFLVPGGHLVLVSPYSWLEEYTAPTEWFGARNIDNKDLDSFEELQTYINNALLLRHREDVPFLIREHARKFQYELVGFVFYVIRNF